MRTLGCTLLVVGLGVLGWTLQANGDGDKGEKKVDTRIFELRIYYVNPGKMEALNARFKNHTNKLLEKHGMQLIGFWTDAKEPERKLYYIVAHKSKDAAAASWKAFGQDPEWKAAKAKSEEGGVLVEKVDSIYMNPTDYSAIK
jgi:hypothetical protein